jgi:hypothetical protein
MKKIEHVPGHLHVATWRDKKREDERKGQS